MDTSMSAMVAVAHRQELLAESEPYNPNRIISQLSSIILHLSKANALSDVDELLHFAAVNLPRLVNSVSCAIYLRPELVPLYDGLLLDEHCQAIRAEELRGKFVVLSATSRSDIAWLIGKAYYPLDSGPVGWVCSHALPLRASDRSRDTERRSVAPGPSAADGGQDQNGGPILIVPLVTRAGNLGIVLFPATLDQQPFTRAAEEIAVIIAQNIANILEKTWILREQDRHIRYLVDIEARHLPRELFTEVTQRLGQILNTRPCQLYFRINGGDSVKLVVEDGLPLKNGAGQVYKRGQDLIGWVFKTGKPLLIPDLNEFISGKVLTGDDLDHLSDGAPVNTEDRFLQCGQHTPRPVSFLAVPIKDSHSPVLGVLSAQRSAGTAGHITGQFNRDDLHLMQSFASTIALAIGREWQRKIGDLLTSLGLQSEPQAMFDLVASQLPELVSTPGCNIYVLENGDGPPPRLRLIKTSYTGLMSQISTDTPTYQLGESKTGFCALARATLVVNHYGPGEANQRKIDAERSRIRSSRNNDLVDRLTDEHSETVGLIWLQCGVPASPQIQGGFHTLAKQLVIHQTAGLPSSKAADDQSWGVRPAWSFIAVPIKTDANEVHGVITVGRPVPGIPFSADDVALLESIAGRLASAIHTMKAQERQKRLMITLAHEISTPLQGILADTENLIYEIPDNDGLSQLASHTLHQVQQLHLLTETIMTVLSEQTPARSFSIHNIYRPLKEACKMFEREAAAKGCDILEPRPIGSRFPDIEMSLFDLTLAFKNLIHNAVKYSFHPPRHLEGNRYIRIIGRWADAEHRAYSISIENYGVGIPPEEIDNGAIFTPYYRGVKASDRRRTGTGLGLAHARQIIEDLHHGTISVTSKHIAGEAHLTTFTATLPVHQPTCVDALPQEQIS